MRGGRFMTCIYFTMEAMENMKINKLSNFVCVFAAFSVSTAAQQIEINKYDPENKKTLKVKSSKRETAQRRNAITSRWSQHLLSAFNKTSCFRNLLLK